MPGERVELPRGHWVVLKDPWEITERERQPLQVAFLELGQRRRVQQTAAAPGGDGAQSPVPGAAPTEPKEDAASTVETMSAFGRDLVAFFVVEWDLDKPISADSMLDLPVPLYNAIDDLVGPLVAELFPNLGRGVAGTPTTP